MPPKEGPPAEVGFVAAVRSMRKSDLPTVRRCGRARSCTRMELSCQVQSVQTMRDRKNWRLAHSFWSHVGWAKETHKT